MLCTKSSFIDYTMCAFDTPGIERTRLERRFEKLVDLHFRSPEANEKDGSATPVKGKSRAVPHPMRRASSLFELDINDLKNKSASELWRGVLENRAAATGRSKGDIRGQLV